MSRRGWAADGHVISVDFLLRWHSDYGQQYFFCLLISAILARTDAQLPVPFALFIFFFFCVHGLFDIFLSATGFSRIS
jgi:hypothetical protein